MLALEVASGVIAGVLLSALSMSLPCAGAPSRLPQIQTL